MKTERIVEKLCEIAIHVGLRDRKPTIDNVIKGLKESKCEKCETLADDLAQLESYQSVWTDNKVIDFVNWFIHLYKIDDRFELENQTIIDSFLKGDDYKLWWAEEPKPIEMIREAFEPIQMGTDPDINAYAEQYPNYLEGCHDWNNGMKHGIKHGAMWERNKNYIDDIDNYLKSK
jgi:hypothetical protein